VTSPPSTVEGPAVAESTESRPGPGMAVQAWLGFRLSRVARTLGRAWAEELVRLHLSPP